MIEPEFNDRTWGAVETATSAPSIHYINETGLSDDTVLSGVVTTKFEREIASEIEKWSQSLAGGSNEPTIDMFNRRKWQGAGHVFAKMAACAWAVEHDDILSTLADVIEGLSFQKCRFMLYDPDQQDLWNQWAGTIDLDSRLRELSREIFKVSQFYCGVWWERRVYSVRDDQIRQALEDIKDDEEAPEDAPAPIPPKRRGNRRRKKKFAVEVPTALSIFDPTKVLPVGSLLFGRERFAYVATREEDEAFARAMRGDVVDATVLQLLEGRYKPTGQDRVACAELGVDYNHLWLFKKDALFRHTLTKAQYERFAPVRLESILPLLEMKQHLRSSDRASLIGNTNFIVVITKGTDKHPAKSAELANLREQARVIARLPVLVGDHRLKVEIIAPPLENTLIESRYQVLDSRLVFRALQTFSPVVQGGNSSGTGVSEMSRVVARGLESRRHMLVRSLERHLFQIILDRNPGVIDETPSLVFSPKRVALDFKADVIQQILKLRDRGDLSRATMLEELDYDQDVEVLRRARERVAYDDTFQSAVPHSSPQDNPFGAQNPGQQPGTLGPKGQPKEGGRPAGVTEAEPRARKGTKS